MKHKLLLAILIVFSFVLCLVCINRFYVGFINDDVIYILQAKKIVEGRGIQEIFFCKYPPGYPLILAPLIYIFPDTFFPLQVLSIFFFLGTLILSYIFFKEKMPAKYLFLLLLFMVLNNTAIQFSGTVMSDIPFLFFSLVALIVSKKELNVRNLLIIAVLSAICFYIRTAGGVLFISFLLLFLIRKIKISKILIFSMIFFILLSPYFFFKNFSAYKEEAKANYAATEYKNLAIKNLKFYLTAVPFSLYGDYSLNSKFLKSKSPLSFFNLITSCAIVFLIICAILLKISQKEISVIEIYILAYSFVFILWPYRDIRFSIPVIPFLYYYLILGFQIIENKFKLPGKILANILIIIIILFQTAFAGNTIRSSIFTKTHENSLPAESYRWLKNNTKKEEAIMTINQPSCLNIYAQMKTIGFDITKTAYRDIMAYILKTHTSYIYLESRIQWQFPEFFQRQTLFNFSDLLHLNPDKFKLVYINSSENTRIFKVITNGKAFFNAFDFFQKGSSQIAGGDYNKAIDYYIKCIGADLNFFEAYLNIGILYEKQNNFNKAIEVLEELIKRNPNYTKAYISLAYAYKSIDNKQKAIGLLEEAYLISQSRGDILLTQEINEIIKNLKAQGQ